MRAKSEMLLFEDQCSGWYGFFGQVCCSNEINVDRYVQGE